VWLAAPASTCSAERRSWRSSGPPRTTRTASSTCDQLGRHLGYKTLRARYKKALKTAKLRELRFHDLRHTFGTHAIRAADPREVMEWMGHADIQTTQKYLAYKPCRDAAKRLAAAFEDAPADATAEA
jgi:integrase